ncbi:hypothetical protein CBS9595_002680 [Malassezia furfur]|nr:hypothetical protein CBS9595_002680 [Malassezia furfur]
MAPKSSGSPARPPSKRWSSIISQPSIFRKSSADNTHRFSTVDPAGPGSDVMRMFRPKRFLSSDHTPCEDVWEIRSSSCCEFDRLRKNLALDDDPTCLESLFCRLIDFSLTPDPQEKPEIHSDAETLSLNDDDQSMGDMSLPSPSLDGPKLGTYVPTSTNTPIIIAPEAPPKPPRSSLRPVYTKTPAMRPILSKIPAMELSLSQSSSQRASPALSGLETPPLEPSRSGPYLGDSGHSSRGTLPGLDSMPESDWYSGFIRSSSYATLSVSPSADWSAVRRPELTSPLREKSAAHYAHASMSIPVSDDYLHEIARLDTHLLVKPPPFARG